MQPQSPNANACCSRSVSAQPPQSSRKVGSGAWLLPQPAMQMSLMVSAIRHQIFLTQSLRDSIP
eukprot:12421640-Karenia_brevis.AAC.1